MEKVYIAVRKSGKYNAGGEVTYEGMMVILGVYERYDEAYDRTDEDYFEMCGKIDMRNTSVKDGKVQLLDCDADVMYSWDVLKWNVGSKKK